MFDKQYTFYGKHARMVKALTAKMDDEVARGFFKYAYEIYRLAPVVGYVYNRKGVIDRSEGDSTNIFAEQMRDHKDDFMFNYRVIMMLENKDKTDEEKMNIAFRMEEKDAERKEYDDLFNAYVLGGVEEIYEQIFKDSQQSKEEYIMNMYDFIENLNVRLGGSNERNYD